MKKVSLIMRACDAQDALMKLRALGVLHVQHQQLPKGQEISVLHDDLAFLDSALTLLSNPALINASAGEKAQTPADWKFVAKHVINLGKRLEQLEEYSRALKIRIAEWEKWGDFDPAEIKRLEEKGIFLKLYEIPLREMKNIPAHLIVKTIFVSGGAAHCAVIAHAKEELAYKEITLPKLGLSASRTRLYEDARLMEIIQDDLIKHLIYRQELDAQRKKILSELEFQEALKGMGEAGALSYVTGFVPAPRLPQVTVSAKQEKWGLVINDPTDEDTVPTLLNNPRWVTLIQPVLNLLGVSPGYRELDVSLLFLIFFSIFFGILIGDAGYGLSYLLLTLWFQKKKGVNAKSASTFLLFYVLSSCAIIWGVLTATFFGQAWLAKLGVKPLVAVLNDPVFMQTFCFFLGALHLSIAHAWRAVLKFPSLAALADIGWIGVLWAAFFLARTLILAQPYPGFVSALIWCGIASVVLFTSPNKNIFKAVGNGLSSVSFGLNFMSTFTDVVSYVRLFAVGLAGVAIADTTNSMAAGLGPGVVAVIAGGLITIIGHILNIVLGPMSVLVHGVRLNVLEFSGHASVSWSGESYKPLAVEKT